MQCAIGVEMASNRIRVKFHEEDIVKLLWNQLEASVRIVTPDRFTKDKHLVFKDEL